MVDQFRRGQQIVIGIIAAMLLVSLLSGTLRSGYGDSSFIASGVRVALLAVLSYMLYQGYSWARWLLVVLLALAALAALLGGVVLGSNAAGLVLILVGLVYGACVVGLFQPSVAEFLASQRALRGV